jgi:F-type H+-transporting ATPase subunit b
VSSPAAPASWYKQLFGFSHFSRQPVLAHHVPASAGGILRLSSPAADQERATVIPDLSALWVIGFLLTCTFLLNTLVFQPILRVIAARLQAVADARDLAQSASDRATAAATEYNQTLNAARSDVYRQMDDKRRGALDRRAALLADTRATVQRELNEATRRVKQQAEDARATLDREADTLAGAIVSRVLGRAS